MALSKDHSSLSQDDAITDNKGLEAEVTSTRHRDEPDAFVRFMGDLVEFADDGDEIVETAIDFFFDGSTRVHYSRGRVGTSPVFRCPVLANSIRIIFSHTRDVLSNWSPSRARRRENDINARIMPDCESCMPMPMHEANKNENDSASYAPSTSASVCGSHVSPKTKLSPSERSDTRSSHSAHDDRASVRNRSRSSNLRELSPSTKSIVSDAATPGEKEAWKRYWGGSSLNPLSVSQIWERGFGDAQLVAGVNLMFDPESASGREDEAIWSSRIPGQKHNLTLNGVLTCFFTVPSLLKSSWQNHEKTLEIEMQIFTTQLQGRKTNAAQSSSPLGDELWNILCSRKSAMTLFDGQIDMGARLIAFDMLAATFNCWFTFLDMVRRKSARQPRTSQPLLGDREYVDDFTRCLRDLLRAQDVNIEAIERADGFDTAQKAKFREFRLSHQRRRETIQSIMEDIQTHMDRQIARAEKAAQQRQDDTLKRLTLVASIFLPLTTACSLLSMSTRVRDIGAIWWDWLGIVVVISFLVIVGYHTTSSWHKFWHQLNMQSSFQHLQRIWMQAENQVLDSENKNKARSGGSTSGRMTTSLVPASSRFIFRTSIYILMMTIVASFLVGMFVSVSTGAKVLGYGIAAVVMAAVAALLVWKIVKFITVEIWGVFKKPTFRLLSRVLTLIDNHIPDDSPSGSESQSTDGSLEGKLKTAEDQADSHKQKATATRRERLQWRILKFALWPLGAIMWVCVYAPISLSYKALKYVFALFLGNKTRTVASRAWENQRDWYKDDKLTSPNQFWKKRIAEIKQRLSPSELETNNAGARPENSNHGPNDEEKLALDNDKPPIGQGERGPAWRGERGQDDSAKGAEQAKIWTEDEVKRRPTQNFLIKDNKIQRRVVITPQDRR